MVLDAVTVRNLELVEPLFAAARAAAIDAARRARPDRTGMGGRLLRQRLLRPSMDRAEIEQRLDAVGEIAAADHPARRTAQAARRHSRSGAAAGEGDARVRPVRATCWRWAGRWRRFRAEACFDTQQARARRSLHDRLDELPDVANRILEAIADEPPSTSTDGGTIRAGFIAELDELRDLSRNGRQYIAQIEARERQRTGIAVAEGPVQQRLRLLHRDLARRTCTWRRPTTSASRRWPMPSASPRPS